MIEVLRKLGSSHVLAFHGSDGLDEITTTGPTWIWELKDGEVTERQIDSIDLGFKRAGSASLKGATPRENAKIALEVLSGVEGPYRDLVLINAAAGIVAAGTAGNLAEGVEQAIDSIDSGRARQALDELVETSNRYSA
jgi:anthranilate phosphoribosyltransferase